MSPRDRAWKHIAAEEFDLAEPLVRQCLAEADPADHEMLWHLHGWLASVLNSLARHEEANLMLRESLRHARAIGPDSRAIDVARYFLANQELLFGRPEEALVQATPVPEGVGHTQCQLHSIVAQALLKLGRRDEARRAAQAAIDCAPTPEARAELAEELAELLAT